MNKMMSLMVSAIAVFGCRHSDEKEPSNKYQTLEYADIGKLNIKLPYVYECGDRRKLLVYGSNHTMNPRDPQVTDIEKRMMEFKPDLVLYEGDGIATAKTKSSSVSEYFELGLVKYLADSLGIKTRNIEPPTKDKYSYLLRKYPKEEVLLAILGLQITMMQAERKDLRKEYPAMAKALVDEGFPLEKNEMKIQVFYCYYRNYFKHDFSYESFDSRLVQSKYSTTSLNRINQDANKYRDQYIIGLVEGELKAHQRIYLQIGGWHAIVCEPAFRKITG
jgi:hypothetical protein